MIPYGYRIENGHAVINQAEAAALRQLFTRFIGHNPLKVCAEHIPHAPQTCKKMLSNPIYLGTDFFPAIITQTAFDAAQKELAGRVREVKQPQRIKSVPVWTEFQLMPCGSASATLDPATEPATFAAYQYRRIRPIL